MRNNLQHCTGRLFSPRAVAEIYLPVFASHAETNGLLLEREREPQSGWPLRKGCHWSSSRGVKSCWVGMCRFCFKLKCSCQGWCTAQRWSEYIWIHKWCWCVLVQSSIAIIIPRSRSNKSAAGFVWNKYLLNLNRFVIVPIQKRCQNQWWFP